MPQREENLTFNAIQVLKKRYLRKNEKGEIVEDPQEMFRRVASAIAEADIIYKKSESEIKKIEEEFYKVMSNLEFMPNSPTLMNAGRELGQLSACFVLPIDDSMENIFETIKQTAIIHKTGGGTGFSFSRLRPKNSVVKTTGGIASGPVSFMKVFDAATQAVKQGGCVAPDTRISTSKGLKKIENIVPKIGKQGQWQKFNPHPVKVATDSGEKAADEFYNNGEVECLKLTTTNGYSITLTPEHKLRVISKEGDYIWRHARDIKLGDWLALQKDTYFDVERILPEPDFNIHFNSKKVILPREMSKELGEFIGIIIGDGSMSFSSKKTGRIIISLNEEEKELIKYLFEISRKLFNLVPLLSKKKNDKCNNYFFNSTILAHWLKQIGIKKPCSRQAEVPEIVFNSNRKFTYGFLRGLFSCDGTVSKDGYPSFTTASFKLAKDIQTLLLSLGVPSSISKKSNRKDCYGKKSVYLLSIVTLEGLEKFVKEIGFFSKKKNKRLTSCKNKKCEFNDIIPNQEKLLRDIYNGPGRGCAPNRSSLGDKRELYRDIQHNLSDIKICSHRNLTRNRLKKLFLKHSELKQNSRLRWFLENNQFYNQVKSIKKETKVTLDIAVPENNTYIANGFVSHNTRRGANMGILRVDHPDILDFITCKEDDNQINNFNISVAVTDDFMDKVEKNEDYELINPYTKEVEEKLNAKKVFDLICNMAWKNGEPGVIFIDRMNKFNPTPNIGEYESTNPCGEQILLPNESCNLGSINLSLMVDKEKNIDWDKLERITKTAVCFLDNVIDINKFPLKEIEKKTKNTRKIGLGVMGWADLLTILNVPYNSEKALSLAEEIMGFILEKATEKSIELAKEKGNFPAFRGSIFDVSGKSKMRNATLTTIAPTGTISIISSCSSGIEPLFALAYTRHVMDNDKLTEVNPLFEKIAKERGFYSEDLIKKLIEKGSCQELDEVPEDVKKVFVTSHDISPEWHIKMQAAFQKYTNNAVSKTINFHQNATVEKVRNSYLLAFKSGCKGITIYRDKSRSEQVLNINSKKETEIKKDMQKIIEEISPRPRPKVTVGTTTKIATGCGNLYITINEDDKGLPFEVFMQMGKAGGCAASQLEAIGRLVSLSLRSGMEVKSVVDQLRGIRCPSPSWEKDSGRIFSCADAIAQVIERRLGRENKDKQLSLDLGINQYLPGNNLSQDSELLQNKTIHHKNIVGVCPDCGSALQHEEGCMKCMSCGYSKC